MLSVIVSITNLSRQDAMLGVKLTMISSPVKMDCRIAGRQGGLTQQEWAGCAAPVDLKLLSKSFCLSSCCPTLNATIDTSETVCEFDML